MHAVTQYGSLLIASASGSQLGPIVLGAGHVILVNGDQTIVPPDVAAGVHRIYVTRIAVILSVDSNLVWLGTPSERRSQT